MNTAVIGAGNWGKNIVRVLAQMPQINLNMVCDADEKVRRRAAALSPGSKVTDSVAEVVDNSEVEAVVIATHAPSHFQIAERALLAGKHVLVEKPLTLDPSHAERLVGLAAENELVLMTGHLLIYHPAVEMLKQMAQDGELGKIYYIYAQRVNLGVVRSDENALWSLAPHDISIILHLLGRMPDRVSARGGCYIRDNIEDVVFLVLGFEDGTTAHVQLSWLDPHKERKITVVGSRRMVIFDDMQAAEKVKIFERGEEPISQYNSYAELLSIRQGDILIPHIDMKEPLMMEMNHFRECVKEGKPCLSPGSQGQEVVRVLDAASRSLANGGETVPLDR